MSEDVLEPATVESAKALDGAEAPPPLEVEVEDLVADTIDILLSHTEGHDAFSITRKSLAEWMKERGGEREPGEHDTEILLFIVTPNPASTKASGIIIGRDGVMADALRTIVRHLGLAHGRQFRFVIDTPRRKPVGGTSEDRPRPRRHRSSPPRTDHSNPRE